MSAHPDFIDFHRGEAPLVVSFPHTGTEIPDEIVARLPSAWIGRKDADWWIDQLYAFAAEELGATTIRTRISRTVIDCNRDPSGASLYPGQATTELCPTTTFDGEPLYKPGDEPDAAEIAARRARWFDPYHALIASELDRLKAKHGAVVIYDAHSIRSQVPRLFEGLLPHFNIGTNNGATCDPKVAEAVVEACEAASDFTSVLNGRFKGGWTTRHYGRPEQGVHAIQMELSCRGYMNEPIGEVDETWPPAYDPACAAPLRAVLKTALANLVQVARELSAAKVSQ